MAEPKKKSALLMAFGPPGGKDDEPPPVDGDAPDGDDADFDQACDEFFMAAGIKPIDKKGACEALKALIDICMSGDDKGGEEPAEEPEEPEAA
jgi:hypothetical protein